MRKVDPSNAVQAELLYSAFSHNMAVSLLILDITLQINMC